MSTVWRQGTRVSIASFSKSLSPSTGVARPTNHRLVSSRSAINQGLRKEGSRERYHRLGGLFRAQRSDDVESRDRRRLSPKPREAWASDVRNDTRFDGQPRNGSSTKKTYPLDEVLEGYKPFKYETSSQSEKDLDIGFSAKQARPTRRSPTSIRADDYPEPSQPLDADAATSNGYDRPQQYREARKEDARGISESSRRTEPRSGQVAPHRAEKAFGRSSQEQFERSPYPLSVPYTTAASEFLYGYGEVFAALKAKSRKSYKIYIHQRGMARDGSDEESSMVKQLAQAQGIKIIEGRDVDIRLLDKMSGGRPHNGVVLEASRLPMPPATSLAAVNYPAKDFYVRLARQSKEDLAINGSSSRTTFSSSQPVVLLIDDVLDTGNLGAILRSAYFLGIQAVVLTDHCAPLNSVALKASAGAAEAIPMYRVARPELFLRESVNAGWHAIAATTPRSTREQARTTYSKSVRYTIPGIHSEDQVSEWANTSPKIIVVGGEGRGLRGFLTKEVQSFIEIMPQMRDLDMGIDSLNVSVATSLVCHEILSRIREPSPVRSEITEPETMFSYG